MDEFLILLQAKLDEAKSKGNVNADIEKLQGQLDKLKIQVTLDPKSVQSLADEIGKLVNQKIVISNIGIDNSGLNKSGQKAAENFSNGVSQGIKKSSNILNSFKKSLENIGMGSKEIDSVVTRISGLVTEIQSLDQTRTSGKKDILSVNIAGIDQYGQAIKLTQQYDAVTGELVNAIDNVSTVQQKAGSATEAFIEKQRKAIASAQNTLSTIETKLNDSNITKSLANTDFDSNGLNTQLERVRTSISALENASRDTFTQAQIGVDKEITSLNNLITTLKNAEYAATSLRTKDINTVKIDEGNNLNTFVQKMEQSRHYTDELKQKVENLKVQLNGVFDANTLTSYLNSLSNLKSEFKSVDATAKTLEKSTKLQTNIEAEKKTLQVYTNELKEAGVLTNDVKEKIQNMFYSLSKIDSQNGLTTWRAELKGVKAETDAVLKSVTQLSQKKIDKIQLSMSGQGKVDYNWQVDEEIKKLKNLGFTEEEVAQQVKVLTDAHTELKRVMASNEFDSIEIKNKAIVESDRERTLALNQVKNAYKELKIDANQYYNLNKQAKLSTDIQNWLSKNSRASKEAKESLNAYYRELSDGRVSVDRLNYIEKELKSIDATQRGLGKLGKNLKDQFIEAGRSFTQWLSVSSAVMALVYQLQRIPKEVYEIDTAMNNLYKVTDETSSKYNQFLDSASKSAHELGRSISSLVEQTANWAKLGFSLDEAEQLAKISSIYANVGEVDNDTAVSDMVTAMKAFNIEASDSITIVDKLNKLGNEYATSAAALGDGLSRSASAMATSGTDINKTLAMLTGGTEITQNASEFGNFLKIGSMRIRGKLLCLHTGKVCMRCCA